MKKKDEQTLKKLQQTGGGMTLREHEYDIGTNNQVNINKVVIYAMCINPKKNYKKNVWKRA